MKRLTNIVENSYILTKNGYQYIEDILGDNIIWDGYNWKNVIISKNNEISQEKIYYKVLLSDGCEVICDETHKLYIVDNMLSNIYRTTPITLIKNNTLIYKYSFPLLEGNIDNDLNYPYFLGYIAGYIYNINNSANKIISEEKIKEIYSKFSNDDINYDHLLKLLEIYTSNLTIPINATINNKLLWISGLIDINGSITKIKDGIYLNITVNSKDFAMKVKYLFNTLGTNPKILENTEIRKVFLSVSSNIKLNTQETSKIRYRLLFNADDTNKIFLDYNIITYFFIYDKMQYSLDQDINRYLSIKKITKVKNIMDTYNIKNSYTCIINGALI
jgi:hypothetical protein